MSLNNLNAVIVERSWKPVSSELKHHKNNDMHTIKNSKLRYVINSEE